MKKRIAIIMLAKSTWHDFVRARRALIVFDILFKLLEAWLLVPAVALMLAFVLAGAGHVAVSNRDILEFLLSPFGLLYASLLGVVAAGVFLLEQAGIMVVAALIRSPERLHVKRMLRVVLRKSLLIIQLGAIKLVLVALTFTPFVLLAILTYFVFLTQHDIYFYVTDRPPVFWVAAGIGAVILLAATVAGVALYVRWAFALPILLFEDESPRVALRASRERIRGASWQVGLILLGWQFVTLLLGVALLAGFRSVAATVLVRFEDSLTVLVILLVAQGVLLAVLSFVAVVGGGLITRRLYLMRSEQVGSSRQAVLKPEDGSVPRRPVLSWRLAFLILPALLAPLSVWVGLPNYVDAAPPVRVTAHRGHSRAAPENTLSAIRKAIESGADYAEVDAQQTADGVIVLLHDRDLMRVAGISRRLDEFTYDEIRKLDVGSWFAPAFAGERVPTLAEAIDLARGRIKLNIELKLFGPDRGLARAVAALVRDRDLETGSLVTSFDYEALVEAKRLNPRLRTGLIVAHALGDVTRLEVDAFSVRLESLSDDLLRQAGRFSREVHVWTINNPRDMARQIKRGVDNIITSDPDLAIRVRNEWANLSGTERLLLSSRLLLGLNP